ncbi:MAG: hypothetical protein V9G19_17290 [Tetrasphaera sp.]
MTLLSGHDRIDTRGPGPRFPGGEPDYDPGRESLTAVLEEEDGVLVQTTVKASVGPKFREYELVRLGDDWRIRRIGEYCENPSNPFCAKDKIDNLVARARPDAALRPLSASDARADCPALFTERDVIDADGEHALERRVDPGTYEVDIAIAYERTAALRVTLAPGEPVSWHPASVVDGGPPSGEA